MFFRQPRRLVRWYVHHAKPGIASRTHVVGSLMAAPKSLGITRLLQVA